MEDGFDSRRRYQQRTQVKDLGSFFLYMILRIHFV